MNYELCIMNLFRTHRTNTIPIVTAADAVPVDALLVEVQAASEELALLAERRRPVAADALIVVIRAEAVASGREKDRVAVLSCEFRSVHAVDLRHLVLTLLY